MEVARLVNVEEDEHMIHTRPSRSIAVRERLLELSRD